MQTAQRELEPSDDGQGPVTAALLSWRAAPWLSGRDRGVADRVKGLGIFT